MSVLSVNLVASILFETSIMFWVRLILVDNYLICWIFIQLYEPFFSFRATIPQMKRYLLCHTTVLTPTINIHISTCYYAPLLLYTYMTNTLVNNHVHRCRHAVIRVETTAHGTETVWIDSTRVHLAPVTNTLLPTAIITALSMRTISTSSHHRLSNGLAKCVSACNWH